MAMEQTALQDCLSIIKKFERAAAFAPTEESVFAMMSIPLQNMRIHSQSFINQMNNSEALSTPQATTQTIQQQAAPNIVAPQAVSPNMSNLDKADENQDFFARIGQNFFPDTGNINDLGGVFNSECIPCGFRLDTMGQLVAISFQSPFQGISEFIKFWEQWLIVYLQQINEMINMFGNMDKYVDLCALIKFLNDFVCIPDLQRMLSALMANMNRTSFQFGSVLDFLISLVAPLLTPFLSAIVEQLQKYILMVIKPLECIIDSIQAIIAKLDYNILFQNIDSLDKHVSVGPKKGETRVREDRPTTPDFLPFIGGREFGISEETLGQDRVLDVKFSMAGPLGTAVKAQNAKDQKEIEKAAEDLAKIRKAASNVNGANPEAVRKHREKEQAADQKYRAAIEKRNLSAIGGLNRGIDRSISGLKSSLFMLIGYLRQAAEAIQQLFDDLFDEFKKLMGEYVIGSGGILSQLVNKLALTQLIGLVQSIMKAFQNGVNCNKDDEDIRVEAFLPIQQGMKVWTDDQGNVHIEEDSDAIDSIIDDVVRASGIKPIGSVNEKKQEDKGDSPDSSRQKLNSLIDFTGDPTIDLEIARAADRLTTPNRGIFKCPLQISVSKAAEINKWISEVNSI